MPFVRKITMIVCFLAVATAELKAQVGSAFTYQGYLENSDEPVDDLCDFRLRLWDDAVGGSAVGDSPVDITFVVVTDGIFTLSADFGSAAFDGTSRWLQIQVRCWNDADFVPLQPRVELTPAPHALALPGFYTRPVVQQPPLNNAENGDRAGPIVSVSTPNIIGGWKGNSIAAGVVGGTISGGGSSDWPHSVSDEYGTVSGGAHNHVGNDDQDVYNAAFSTVGGGYRNSATNLQATVSGGYLNNASGQGATVGGGEENSASGRDSTVGGGTKNQANGIYSAVVGGEMNQATASWSMIGGGSDNVANGIAAAVGGGDVNKASGITSVVSGGSRCEALGDRSTVGGGELNRATATNSTVGGGSNNSAGEVDSLVCGGRLNLATGINSSVVGGLENSASASGATVGGGSNNMASNSHALVSGGATNVAAGAYATVPGGRFNRAGGDYSFAAGINAIVRDAAMVGDNDGDEGTFVWSDSSLGPFQSTDRNQFLIRATGGVGINTNQPAADLHIAGKVKAQASVVSPSEPLASLQNTGNGKGLVVDAMAGWLEVPDPQGQGGEQNNAVEVKNQGEGRCLQTECRVPNPNGDASGHSCVRNRIVLYDPNDQTPDRAPDISQERFAAGQGEGYAARTPAVIGDRVALAARGGGTFKPVVGYVADADDIGVWAAVPYEGARGVQAHARDGIAVYGSTNFPGFPDGDIATNPNAIGVKGYSYAGTAIVGESPTGLAARFLGDVEVTGDWIIGGALVTGGMQMDGSMRALVSDADLELHASAGRAMRVEANGTSSNIILGHANNAVSAGALGAAIGGGGNAMAANQVTDDFGTIGGGENNVAGDGAGTTSDRSWATVSGGADNMASGVKSTIGGGGDNVASSLGATVAGGIINEAFGMQSTVGGGALNSASGGRSTISGGYGNSASGTMSVVAGGWANGAFGELSIVGGGVSNNASGVRSTIPGGENNFAGGSYSLAAGLSAIVRDAAAVGGGDLDGDEGTFVWSDASGTPFVSTGPNQFLVRASGGVGINQNNPTAPLQVGTDTSNGNGAYVSVGGVWTNGSDRETKQNFEEVDSKDILRRVVTLPIGRWQYKGERPDVRHIGPVAQDFYAAFSIGDNDRYIGTIDADGVALAAIQGLNQIVAEKDQEIECLGQEVAQLRTELAEIQKALRSIRTAQEGGAH